MKRLSSRGEFILLAIIVLVAIFFRTFRLSELPRGMTGDEAVRGLEASLIARGEQYPIFIEENFGEEPMHAYLVALLFRLFGTSVLTIRATSTLIGIATVPLFYLLVKELFPPKERGSWPTVAILATTWLATSYWHTVYSRYGLEPILVPLYVVLILYFLWQGLNSGRRLSFIGAGFFLGLSLYTYQAARFLPLLVLLLLACRAWADRGFLRTRWGSLVGLLAAFLVAAAPLAIYALSYPEIFFSRAEAVSILNPDLTGGSPLRSLLAGLSKTAGMYNFQGDLSPVHNPSSGRPVLDPLTSIFFILGLGIAVYRRRELAYLSLLVWFLVMSLPAAITAEGLPHFSRAIGALPVVYILSAIGVVATWKWLEARAGSGRLPITFSLLLSIPVFFAGVTTYGDYFVAWDEREDLRQGYDGAYTAAAAVMNQTHVPESVWILPLTAFVPSGYGADHFDFLYHGDTPYYSVSLDETTVPDEISSICRGKRKALVVDWKGYALEEAYNAMAADPKGLIPFLFCKYGREVNRKGYEAFDIVTYELPESPALSITEGFEPLAVNFGHELMLLGVAFGGSSLQDTSTALEVEERELPSGKSGWVVLQWQALRVPSRHYKVTVYLQDANGDIVGQVDKLLLSNHLRLTSQWEPGQVEIDYYTLPSLPATPPGEYHIEVAVYDPDNLVRLPISGEMAGRRAFTIGALQIIKPLVSPDVKPQVWLGEEIAPEIRLLGYDLPPERVGPGEEVTLTLYWKALKDVASDYLFSLQLKDGEGEVRGEEVGRPVDGRHPTTEWEKDEVVRDGHKIPVGAGAPEGTYTLSLKVMEGRKVIEETALATITIEGRPHQFTIPPIQYPLQARLGEGIELLGYDLSPQVVKPGDPLRLTLHWRALGEMKESYTVFTHLLDEEGRIWGQKDSIPGGGSLPTTSWVEGEIITDEYEIMMDPETPAGTYLIEIGIYLAETGERLPVYNAEGAPFGDRILLPSTIEVTP